MAIRTFISTGVLSAALLAFTSVTPAQQTPPTSAQAKRIVAMVEKAAGLVNSNGKTAFEQFRNSGSEWRNGDTYVFVGDMQGKALLNVGFPKLEGTDISGNKDASGKLITQELIKTAQSKGSGWVEYSWPKPGQTTPAHKWAFVKAVKVDGTPAYIGAGFYPE